MMIMVKHPPIMRMAVGREMMMEMTMMTLTLMMMLLLLMTMTCILLLVRTMRMTVELPSTAVSEMAQ